MLHADSVLTASQALQAIAGAVVQVGKVTVLHHGTFEGCFASAQMPWYHVTRRSAAAAGIIPGQHFLATRVID